MKSYGDLVDTIQAFKPLLAGRSHEVQNTNMEHPFELQGSQPEAF